MGAPSFPHISIPGGLIVARQLKQLYPMFSPGKYSIRQFFFFWATLTWAIDFLFPLYKTALSIIMVLLLLLLLFLPLFLICSRPHWRKFTLKKSLPEELMIHRGNKGQHYGQTDRSTRQYVDP